MALREIEGLLREAVVELRRSAKAQEDLIRLATEERDYGDSLKPPPMCAHCGTINPKIVVLNHDQPGHMREFVLIAKCQHCQGAFYAVPAVLVPFVSVQEAEAYLSERDGDNVHQ